MAHVLDLALRVVAALEEVVVDGAGQHAGQDVDHHTEAVTLVAAQLTRTAQRRQQTVLHRDVGVGGGIASAQPAGIGMPHRLATSAGAIRS